MVVEILSSPHRRSQATPFTPVSPSFKKPVRDELGSWSAIFRRHRFLLTILVVLAFLCTIYLYFAVTLGAGNSSCSGMDGTEKALCHLTRAKSSVSHVGKLKFF
ncbi:uncharacterized protein [Aristolochia californica]|uniref:uncharacterized protein n=1 Tax=Aristolochia californica TaxID=171875 RepID=UPI0035D59AA2